MSKSALETDSSQTEKKRSKKRNRDADAQSDSQAKPAKRVKKSKKADKHESKDTQTKSSKKQPKSPENEDGAKDRDGDDQDESTIGGQPNKSSRFIVFVGNLPYSCSTDSIEKHFFKVKPASVRHITDKKKGISKGYAFLEFEGYDRMKTCLNAYHGTKLKGRKIRVELTAGGGGAKSQTRRDKIATKNLRLNGQRFRRDQEELKERPKDKNKNQERQPISRDAKSERKDKKKRSKINSGDGGVMRKNDGEMKKPGPATEGSFVNNANLDVHPSRRKFVRG